MMVDGCVTFPIPASLQDLERAPYNLLPYPENFADDDEGARADSFDSLVDTVEGGNRVLVNSTLALFQTEEGEDPWNDYERIQAMYTLVRKSSSLAPSTRTRLAVALSKAVQALSVILSTASVTTREDDEELSSQQQVLPQAFRDALACHMYMLFSVMNFAESEAKISTKMASGKRSENKAEIDENAALRAVCADAMLAAATSMSKHRSKLWKCGVPDESVAILPCRIAYQMLETATGVVARKASSADAALGMLAAAVDSSDSLIGTIVAALVDLLHSYEHMAPLVADLCGLVSENHTNKLALELLREIGRLDPNGGSSDGRASGVKYVAPLIGQIAMIRPRLVLSNISLLLPHLNSEPYQLRSAIVCAIGHILVHIGKLQNSKENNTNEATADCPSSLNLTKSRNALLEILLERSHDTSSFTRAAVLKSWISIVESGSLPLERIMPVTALAIDRLNDKTVMTRRCSMQLLTCLLENNPFLGSLDPSPYRKKIASIYENLKRTMPESIKEAHHAALQEIENADDSETIAQLERAALAAAINEAELMNDADNLSEAEVEFRLYAQAFKFSQSAIDFIEVFENANDAFQGMLLSANTSDVTEALRFFVKARHFKLPCAITGMKQALSLMWSTENNVRDEVLKAFVDVFIAVPGTDGKELLPDNQIAHNLLVLAGRATVSELASIEEALGRLVREEHIPANVFLILWSVASKAQGDARAAAMLVLSMAASADQSIVDSASRLRLLLEAGLGDYTEENRDWRTARSASCALQRLAKIPEDPNCAKYIILEQISERLCIVIRGDWCIDEKINDTLSWFSASEQAIAALFVICPEPEIECAEIIKSMAFTTFGEENDHTACHSVRLARFFFVLGHIALKLLVYSEAISGSVRRANGKKALKKQESADQAKAQTHHRDDSDDAIEAELGVAAEQEAENERRFADISDKEILGRGLISKFSPILFRVVGNEGGKFRSEILKQSATLALCKFMCISSSFCEENLPLLFTALADAPHQDTTLRANSVIALGDHAFRFPNEVEPYTPRLYACLRDQSTPVRRHTLMVLTHLILNDMIKVKGQVCEIAMCLRDEDPRIRDMSRLLFHELSKRSNNPIYNLLPDIISQLSQQSLDKENFRSIMTFLLGFIKKERQNEMLVEKLCLRFPKCRSITEKGNLAFCISQLKINEKSIKCLSDNFKLFKDALFDDDVKKSFFSILSKAKKFAKPEMKECLEDWESKLEEFAKVGGENHLADEKAAKAKAQASRREASRKKKEVILKEDDFSVGSDDSVAAEKENELPRTAPKSARKGRRVQPRRKRIVDDDDDEE